MKTIANIQPFSVILNHFIVFNDSYTNNRLLNSQNLCLHEKFNTQKCLIQQLTIPDSFNEFIINILYYNYTVPDCFSEPDIREHPLPAGDQPRLRPDGDHALYSPRVPHAGQSLVLQRCTAGH